MKHLMIIIPLASLIFSCEENTDGISQSELDQMFSEIKELSESKVCTDASEWQWIPYGTKACGGPQGYVAYSNAVNVENFLELVEDYSNAENRYNWENKVISDCSVPNQPIEIICENGKPILIF